MLRSIPQPSNRILPAKSSDFPSGLVLHYDMQDLGSSKVIDKSGMGNHGVYASLPELRPALNGYCRYFDGSDDLITKAETVANNVITGDFTISTWLSLAELPPTTSTPIWGKRGAANFGSLQITNNGTVWLHFYPATGDMQTIRTLLALSLNTVHNIIVKYVASESGTHKCLYIYINGVDRTYDEGVITAAAVNINASGWNVGGHGWGSFCKETVHDFKIFNRALTNTEIKELFQNEAWRYGLSS
jgi:hypothetical protein